MAIEQIEPANCTVWQFHQRLTDEVDQESCGQLIDSIALHGQRHPVLGRVVRLGTASAVELVYGARRLFAAKSLGIKLLVDIREIDDRRAVVEMEIENRQRTDISPYARGLSYRRWLNAGLFSSQAELAKELNVSEAQVSRLLRYSELPAAVVGAFDSASAIREEWAVALAKACQDPSRRPAVMRRAREASRAERRRPAPVVYRRLIADEISAASMGEPSRQEVVTGSSGKPIYRIDVRAHAVHFIVPRDGLSERLLRELKSKLTVALEQTPDEVLRRRAKAHAHEPCQGMTETGGASLSG